MSLKQIKNLKTEKKMISDQKMALEFAIESQTFEEFVTRTKRNGEANEKLFRHSEFFS